METHPQKYWACLSRVAQPDSEIYTTVLTKHKLLVHTYVHDNIIIEAERRIVWCSDTVLCERMILVSVEITISTET